MSINNNKNKSASLYNNSIYLAFYKILLFWKTVHIDHNIDTSNRYYLIFDKIINDELLPKLRFFLFIYFYL